MENRIERMPNMMLTHKFIYVFDNESRDLLMSKGYSMVKQDIVKNIYVFINKPEFNLSFEKTKYVMSDVLTF